MSGPGPIAESSKVKLAFQYSCKIARKKTGQTNVLRSDQCSPSKSSVTTSKKLLGNVLTAWANQRMATH
jgi:hypothetical protein